MSMSPRRITRALLSVSDKAGLVEFARALAGCGMVSNPTATSVNENYPLKRND